MKMIHMECPNHPEATLEGYILDCELTLGQDTERPAIIICPGGGYVYCSPREGEPIALAYAAKGYHAFILRYSTGRNCAGFAPLSEVDWAVGYIREHAGEWHIHPEKILTCGFSAGGHLALSAGVLSKNKPNGMILGYPMASVSRDPNSEFMVKLMTGTDEITDADIDKLNAVGHIDATTPPVFLFATAEDMLTPYGALAVANKYSSLGKPYELHVFQHGPHGYALANDISADGSSQVVNAAFSTWVDLSVEWLKKVYGQPELVNKSTSKMMQYLKDLGVAIPDRPETKKGADYA